MLVLKYCILWKQRKKSIEDILKEEFDVEDGANHFMNYCERNNVAYEIVTI